MKILIDRAGRIFNSKRLEALYDILLAAFDAEDDRAYFAAREEIQRMGQPIEISIGSSLLTEFER